MPLPRLVTLPYSPYSIKARWALDRQAIHYREVTYVPTIAEPWLRARVGRWRGRVSVPVLLTEDRPIEGSFAIAKWGDAHSRGERLFTSDARAIDAWNACSDHVLDALRARSVRRILRSRRALAENVPVPRVLQPLLWPVAAVATRSLARKYGIDERTDEIALDEVRSGLLRLRDAIAGDYVLDRRFGYADIAMAVTTFFIAPPGKALDRQGDATRECFTEPTLAREFADLIEWRNLILERHAPS